MTSLIPPSALMSTKEFAAWFDSVKVGPELAVCPRGCPAVAHPAGETANECICWWGDPCRACDALMDLENLRALISWSQREMRGNA